MRSSAKPLLLATRSEDKAREIRRILAPVLGRRELIAPHQAGIEPSPEEDGLEIHNTFRANALAKAAYFHARTGLSVLADDSGLVVHALHGAPGVRSKRFSGRNDLHGRELDRANTGLLLQRLEPVDEQLRAAHYACAAVLMPARAAALCAIGSVTGSIARSPAGDHGFGYDPIFYFPPLGATFGQVSLEVKNRCSHRAHAFRALAALCLAQLRG